MHIDQWKKDKYNGMTREQWLEAARLRALKSMGEPLPEPCNHKVTRAPQPVPQKQNEDYFYEFLLFLGIIL